MALTETGLGSKEVLRNPEMRVSSLDLIPAVQERKRILPAGYANVMTATQGAADRRVAYAREAQAQLEKAHEAERVASIEREAREIPPAPSAQDQDLAQLRAVIAGIPEVPRGEG